MSIHPVQQIVKSSTVMDCPPQLSRLLTCALIGLIASGVSWCWPARAADSPRATAELKAQVRSFLLDLDANQRPRRQLAEKELLDLGPRILPLLPAPELLPSPSVKTSVARIRVILERRKAQESVQASRANFVPSKPQLATATLAEWLTQIDAQTTNRVDSTSLTADVLQRPIAREAQSETFWMAMDRICQEQDLRYLFTPDGSTLKLVPATAPQADAPWSATVDGPFRVAVNWVRPRKVAGDAHTQRLRCELAVAPEPRLRALFLKLAAKDFQAVGPQGTLFPAADSDAQFDLPLGEGGRYVRWNLDFTAPGNLSDRDIFPLQVTGRAAMQIAAGSEHIRFTDLVGGEGTARRRGGVTVTVQKIKTRTLDDGTHSLSIKVLVVYDTGGPAFESHRTWIFHNDVYLDHHEGDPLPPNGGFETDLHTNGAVGVTYRFEGVKGSLADFQFVYVAPTLIVDVPVKIELPAVSPPPKN